MAANPRLHERSRADLEARLDEAEATLEAIRAGQIDALVVEGPDGPQTFALQTADHHYRLLVEEMGEGAAILTPSTAVLFANDSFARLLGVPSERIVGDRLRDYIVEESWPAFDRLLAAGGGRIESQLAGQPDPVPVALSLRPLRLEDIEGFCLVVTDLTETRELARSERERGMAEAASRAKDRFLSILGHELRNPLGAIRNALELLKDPPSPDADQKMRRIVARQVSHVSALVDDLLDISRIESGKLEVQTAVLELRSVVASVLESRLLEAADDEIAIAVHEDPERVFVEGDPTRLRQVLENLISNAIRAIGKRGRIEIHVCREGDQAIVRVRDDGRGIPADDLVRIFEPFVQGRSYDESARGGLGLGLSLARRLTEMQGGELSAASAGLGQGAEFTVSLPAREAPRDGRPKSRFSVGSEPLRMLVVDDDRDCADSLLMLMRRDGHDVRVAYSATEAIEQTGAGEIDVVISDLGLPGMDGYALARELTPRLGGAHLIALSGYVDDLARERSRDAGFAAHLGKPVELRRLRRLLEQIGRKSP